MRAQQGQRQAVIVSRVEVNPLKNKQDTNTNTNTNKIELHESLLRRETTGVSWICAGVTLHCTGILTLPPWEKNCRSTPEI